MKHNHPVIDHSLLSPSGRMSKRARKAAEAREFARLFPPGLKIQGEETEEEKVASQRRADLAYADTLDGLADRGMSPRKHRKLAAELRAKWEVK